MDQAYRLCVGMFKQDSTGSVYGKLPAPHSALKWNLTSIIPTGYDFTNFTMGATTVETTERNTITQLTKERQYNSGAITPPTWTLNKLTTFDAGDIISTLKDVEADDAMMVLLCAGYFLSEASGTRTYTVSKAAVGILTTDGELNAEAKQNFTGMLGVQCCHIPLLKPTDCDATMTWNVSTGAIALVV